MYIHPDVEKFSHDLTSHPLESDFTVHDESHALQLAYVGDDYEKLEQVYVTHVLVLELYVHVDNHVLQSE